MDKITIDPVALSGKVKIPPSKSYAHRAIISAFLSNEDCKINNISLSDDILATLSCIKALGSEGVFNQNDSSLYISKADKILPEKITLNCLESGSTLRFFIPIALTFCNDLEFVGEGRLMSRPLSPYFEIFDRLGISYRQIDNTLMVKGSLRPGDFKIDASLSSQFITGLLFALPLLDGDSCIIIDGTLSSKGYIDITLEVLKSFGIEIVNDNYKIFTIKGNQKYKSCEYTVEGDFSQAAFFLVAGALGNEVVVDGLNPNSLQGDKKVLDIIEQTGAKIELVGANAYKTSAAPNMHGITIDVDEVPDLVPILAVLFAFCKGESKIINASRLRLKESDRLATTCDILKKMGAEIIEGEDFLTIIGGHPLYGCELPSHNDHRIAMSAAIAACRCEGNLTLLDAKKAVKKSYPDFFEVYQTLGGKIK